MVAVVLYVVSVSGPRGDLLKMENKEKETKSIRYEYTEHIRFLWTTKTDEKDEYRTI